MASFQPNGQLYDGNGIQPDILVEPAPTDFIGQTDTLLETAIRTIGEKNNSLHLHP
jgi:C-terminal processing protease CtpA/Prc